MTKDLNCTEFQATIGLSMYTLGFAVTPLVTASFSEEFGRQPLYVVSAAGFALSHLTIALCVGFPPSRLRGPRLTSCTVTGPKIYRPC